MKRLLIFLVTFSSLSHQYCAAYDTRSEAAQKVKLYYSLLQQYARNPSRTELYDRIAGLFVDGQGSVCNDIYSNVYGYPAANSDIRNYITAAGAYKNRSGGYPLDIRIDSESIRFDEKGSDGIYVSVMKYVSCHGGKMPTEYNFREVLLIRNDKIVCIFPEKEKPQEQIDTDIYISPVKEGWISGVRMFSTMNEILIRTDFNINGMEGKNAEVSCYFYDGNGYRLMDRNSTYCTSAGQVAAGTNIKPPYSHTKYTDLEIRIPKSELHLNGRRLDVIQIVVVLWDKSHARAEEICRSSVIKFCYEDRM